MANIVRKSENTPAGSWSEWDPFRVVGDLMRWDPWRQMRAGKRHRSEFFLPHFDVKETKGGYVFQADVPGVKESDLDISLTGNRLTIAGKRESQEEREGETQFVLERSHGSFSRTFTLPEGADVDNIKADLREGVLHVELPKKAAAQPKKVQIQAK